MLVVPYHSRYILYLSHIGLSGKASATARKLRDSYEAKCETPANFDRFGSGGAASKSVAVPQIATMKNVLQVSALYKATQMEVVLDRYTSNRNY